MKKRRKTKAQFEAYIRTLIKKYSPILRLQQRIDPQFTDNPRWSYLAFQFSHPYQDCYLYYSERAFADWKDGRTENVNHGIIHELCHALTDSFYAKATERYVTQEDMESEREKLTDLIALIVHGLVDGE